MMNQPFMPMWGVLEHKFASLAGNWAIGATGAVGDKTGAHGMSLTRDNAGLYTLQLLNGHQAATGVPAILHADVSVFADDVDVSNDTVGHWSKLLTFDAEAGTIEFACVDEAGVVRELPEGAVISAHVDVKLSSISR